MALSDRRIREEMEKGDIVISPFRDDNLSTSSYDVTLGEHYFVEQPPDRDRAPIFNIWNKDHVERVWGIAPLRAAEAKDALRDFTIDWAGIAPKDRVILLGPGETILAHTNEFIGGKDHITTMMKARSSLGRSFIEVCKCAGWGDVGYINRWTMEITNNSQHYSIPLVVGRRIAQIVFFETGPILDRSTGYAKHGKYQASNDLATLKKSWDPSQMVPRLYKDRDITQ